MASGQADLFLTYRTNAVIAQRELPSLRIVALPPALQVGVAHGLGIHEAAPASARAFAQRLLAPQAQVAFARHVFEPV